MWEGRHNKCHKFLDKSNEIDRAILELSRKGILKIGMIKVKCGNRKDIDNYSRDNPEYSGNYTS